MRKPKDLPEYDANEHRMLILALQDNITKRDNLRYIKARFTKAWRLAYMRHRIRVSRGVLTPAHEAELAAARATYDRLRVKAQMADKALAQAARDMKRRIAMYQKASLYL